MYVPFWACSAYTLIYVGSLYTLPRLRRWWTGAGHSTSGRNEPRVIRERLWSASASTLACLGAAGAFASRSVKAQGVMRVFEALARLGLALPTPSSLSSNWPLFASLSHYVCTLGCIVGYSVALTALLYLGTLYADFRGKVLPGQRHFRKDNGLQCIRNYVVAPISEELVFRASMLATIQYAEPPVSLACKIFATPLYFGLAHVHHAWEMFALHGKTRHAMHSALLSSALQFAYTIVFGWYADALFLRTGSVLAPCAAHIVCNAMGLPRVARDAKTTCMYEACLTTAIVLSVVGLAAFAYAFGPLTSVALFGGYMD